MSRLSPPSEPPLTPDPSRRSFLAWATWALGGVIAGLASLPVVGAALSPLLRRGESGPSKSDFVPVVPLAELKAGMPRRVEVTSSQVDAWSRQDGIVLGAAWVLKQPSGEVIAFSTVCPHLGCGIDHDPKKGAFLCPCHTSSFAQDGRRTAGPSPRDMDRLETEVKDGWVRVRYVRFKLGQPRAEEA